MSGDLTYGWHAMFSIFVTFIVACGAGFGALICWLVMR